VGQQALEAVEQALEAVEQALEAVEQARGRIPQDSQALARAKADHAAAANFITTIIQTDQSRRPRRRPGSAQ
jgi:hypothetical protein